MSVMVTAGYTTNYVVLMCHYIHLIAHVCGYYRYSGTSLSVNADLTKRKF